LTTTARVRPAAAAPDATPPRWTAFIFRLPGASGRARTALWRALNHLDALKLGQGTWAIPHRDGRPPDLAIAFAQIHGARGEGWAREVGGDDVEDLRLQGRLAETCEQLWDRFFNDADRVAFLAHDDPRAASGQLTELRSSFGQLLARDLVLSAASRRAERRLDDLALLVRARAREREADASERVPSVGSSAVRGTRPMPHSVSVASTIELTDGRVRAVLCVGPAVDAEWEERFNEFEGFAYAPDPGRSALRHNTIVVLTTPGSVESERATALRRIARFEAYEER